MSTECYRDFFPSVGDAMGLFMKRNIDLLDQHSMDSDNVFGMNRRGCEEPNRPPTDPTRHVGMGWTHCGAFVVACKRFVPSLTKEHCRIGYPLAAMYSSQRTSRNSPSTSRSHSSCRG
jgi:hypothetical protein